jgi:hypothetical protein
VVIFCGALLAVISWSSFSVLFCFSWVELHQANINRLNERKRSVFFMVMYVVELKSINACIYTYTKEVCNTELGELLLALLLIFIKTPFASE